MTQTNFDVFCPTCNILVAAKVIAQGSGGFRSDASNSLDEIDAEYRGDVYYVCVCARCGTPFLMREAIFGIPAEFETVTSTHQLYPHEKLLVEGLPGAIHTAYEQAARSYSVSLYEPCLLMCRKCLEAICKILGAQGRDLNSRLQSLFDGGHIDSRLLNWAHEIRLIGNEAAHDVEASVDKSDARDVLDFTEAILIYTFSLTARFQAFQARRATPKAKN